MGRGTMSTEGCSHGSDVLWQWLSLHVLHRFKGHGACICRRGDVVMLDELRINWIHSNCYTFRVQIYFSFIILSPAGVTRFGLLDEKKKKDNEARHKEWLSPQQQQVLVGMVEDAAADIKHTCPFLLEHAQGEGQRREQEQAKAAAELEAPGGAA